MRAAIMARPRKRSCGHSPSARPALSENILLRSKPMQSPTPIAAISGPLVIRHTDKAARSLCPTSLTRNGGSSCSEEPGMEIL